MAEKVSKIPVGCPHDCGGSCLLIAHVEDGEVKHITTDESLPDEPGVAQLRACLKGRAYRQRLYHPDRLKYPLKRTGERGSGKFERISWDEALDTVARNMLEIREKYGAPAIMNMSHSGTMLCSYHKKEAVFRLLNMFGGQTYLHSIVSNEGGLFAAMHTYGTVFTSSEREDLLNSKMIILWGWNPTDSVWGTNTSYYLTLAREKGTHIVAVDPRYTDTAAAFAGQWVPILPGTDTAMLVAMAYVIIDEDLYDQAFLNKYTVGFDKFKEYVLGREDDVPKTPAWAEKICGVPATTIAELARAYATIKPAALSVGHGPGRTNHGEQFHRAAATLCAMTGNIGVPGGDVGVSIFGYPIQTKVMSFSGGFSSESVSVHFNKWADAIIEGRKGGYPSDIRMVYSVAGNTVNQLGNVRKADRALKTLDFMVAHDHFLTATARYADIVLPATTHFERNDVMVPWCFGHYIIYSGKAIEPYGECRNDVDVCAELAERLGIEGFNDTSEEEWLKYLTSAADIPDWEEFKRKGFLKYKCDQPHIAFREQIEDIEANPFSTPSGKIEIYSQSIADLAKPDVPPIPKYIGPGAEGTRAAFPLRLITAHSKKSCNSMFYNLPWVREAERHELWINPVDAQLRGIRNGDLVKVSSVVGATLLPARVTERIVPGVVNIDQGIEFQFDGDGIETQGCANAVCPDVHTSIDVTPYNSTQVEVVKHRDAEAKRETIKKSITGNRKPETRDRDGQLAFYFDQARCTGCHTCVVACKDWHDLPAELVNWRRVTTREQGTFPNVRVSHLSISCLHCKRPACADACPEEAITKRPSDGVVCIDVEKCTGCRACETACPYGAIQFRADNAKAEKCDFCADRLKRNEPPICVASCPMRALDYGNFNELSRRAGVMASIPELSDDGRTGPSILVKPKP